MSEVSERKTMNGKPVYTVEAKSVINFDSGFAPKLLCDGPTFTAGTCCPYSCSFCSVPTTMRFQLKPNGWLTKELAKQGVNGVKHTDIVVRRANARDLARAQLLGHSKAEREKKKVIYASALTDVAANMELMQETVEMCKVILELTNWDIRLLSKSNLLPKVATGLAEWNHNNGGHQTPSHRIIYGVSTGTLDDKLAAAFEEGCPLVRQRIKSLHWLQDNGYRTFGMVCPSLPMPGNASDALGLGKYLKFSADIMAAIRWEKCEHVWAEPINVRDESFTRTIAALEAAGYDDICAALTAVSQDKDVWEQYARATFLAHTAVVPGDKLRFLQYVTKDTRAWWEARTNQGAVIL